MRVGTEIIQRWKPPTTPKGCRSFAGVGKFLSLFCPQPHKLLKPIYDSTGKGRVFHWGTEHQETFAEIEWWLQKPLVLYMHDNQGTCHLYSYTSKLTTGSALY